MIPNPYPLQASHIIGANPSREKATVVPTTVSRGNCLCDTVQ